MKHNVHTDELSIVHSDHLKNLRYICETVTQDIFNEMLRLNKDGICTTLSLAITQLSIFVHRDGECTVHGARLNDAEGLIELLRNLEEITAKEDQNNAEILS